MGKRNKKKKGQKEEKKKEKKHQAYFANKINIYEDKNSCEIRKEEKNEEGEIHLKIQAHTHTKIYEMRRMGEREKCERQESQ